jgi:hypothetical protein
MTKAGVTCRQNAIARVLVFAPLKNETTCPLAFLARSLASEALGYVFTDTRIVRCDGPLGAGEKEFELQHRSGFPSEPDIFSCVRRTESRQRFFGSADVHFGAGADRSLGINAREF